MCYIYKQSKDSTLCVYVNWLVIVFSVLTFSSSVSFECVIVVYIDLVFFATIWFTFDKVSYVIIRAYDT